MKKSDQIRALQAKCDRLVRERDAALLTASAAKGALARLRAERDRSLPEQVRREWNDRWDRWMQAVGL